MQGDPVGRAYAVLGLPRGSSRRDVKQQYKRLVRKWHPDRYANDPVGAADATAQLRRINEAFAVLAGVHEPEIRRASTEPSAPPEPGREPPTFTGRRLTALTAAEIDLLAKAIGRPDPVGHAIRLASWLVPLTLAFVYFLTQRRRGLTPIDAVSVVVFIVLAMVLIARRRWTRFGRR